MKLIIALLIPILSFTKTGLAQELNIIPKPKEVQIREGSFNLDSKCVIKYDESNPDLKRIAGFFNDYLQTLYGFKAEGDIKGQPVQLKIITQLNTGKEGYPLLYQSENRENELLAIGVKQVAWHILAQCHRSWSWQINGSSTGIVWHFPAGADTSRVQAISGQEAFRSQDVVSGNIIVHVFGATLPGSALSLESLDQVVASPPMRFILLVIKGSFAGLQLLQALDFMVSPAQAPKQAIGHLCHFVGCIVDKCCQNFRCHHFGVAFRPMGGEDAAHR